MGLEWIKQQRRTLLNIGLALGAIVILTLRHFSKNSSFDQSGISLYEQWVQDPEVDEASLEPLRKAALPEEVSAHIAQVLITKGEGQKAEFFAKNSLGHLRLHLPEYAEFAEGGLLIASGKLHEALQGALALKERLQAQGKVETHLYKFNLARLESLEEKLEGKSVE
jgi:hypothetical protein